MPERFGETPATFAPREPLPQTPSWERRQEW